MAIDIIARGMIEDSNGNISQLSEKVSNHTDNSDIHVTVSDKENWNSHPNDVMASGNPVTLDGLQGGVPFSEMGVSGKNLIPFPYYDGDTRTSNGVTFTVNADGTVTANGTVPTGKIAYFCISHLANKLIPGTKYTLSGCPEGGGNDKFSLYISERTNDNKSNGKYYLDYGDGITFEMGDYEKYNINIQIRSGVTVDNVVFHPQLELGSAPTEYEAPITGRELTVGVCGKNLTKNIVESGTMSGVSVTKNADNSITLNGTATSDLWLLFDAACPIIEGVTYTFSSGLTESTDMVFGVRSEDGSTSYLGTRTYGSFVSPVTGLCRVRAFAGKDYPLNNLTIYPQLELGDTATEYEPYHGSTTTITPDTNPYTIPNDIRQQEGLNVVSVSEGELSVTGVRKNAAVKKIWDKIDELTTAIIVSNGETE